jgi:DNA-binding NarL/FixJ family response regulator
MTHPLKLLVVDDHAIVREGTAQLIQRHWPDSTVALAADWPQARALLTDAHNIDLVLLDLHLPGVRRFEALRELRQSHPLVPVAVLSGETDPALALQALRLGAAGFVPKTEDTRVLLQAMELILDGGCYVPPFLAGLQALADADSKTSAAAQPDPSLLTPRQRDVLGCLVRGLANKEIARALGLSEPTVKAHLVCIFRVMRVKNRAQAALAAQAWLNLD